MGKESIIQQSVGTGKPKEKPEVSRYNEITNDLKDKRELRKKLASWFSWVVISYVVFICLFVSVYSICCTLSDSVFIAFLGTTTANILALMFIILKGLFK